MLHIGEQVDLIWNLQTIQNLLTFVPFGSCEDKVSHCVQLSVADNYIEPSHSEYSLTSSCNTERPFNPFQFIWLDHRRMRRKPDIQLTRLEVSTNIFPTKTIAHATDALAAEILPHLCQHAINDRLCLRGHVIFHPVHDIEALWSIEWDCITVE